MSTSQKEQETAPKAKQLLFIHQGALGDQLLSLPLIAELRKNHQITYCARGLGLDLMQQFMPMQTYSLDLSPQKLKKDLQGSWGLCISVGLIEWLNIHADQHLSTSHSHTEAIWLAWGRQVTGKYLSPYHTPHSIPDSKHLLIAPGSGSVEKNWPLNHYAKLSQQLIHDVHIRILMGPAELEQGMDKAWVNLNGKGQLILNPSAQQLMKCYEQSTHFIGNDSGPAHLASVYNLKGTTIFKHSNHNIWAPYGEHLKVHLDPTYEQIEYYMKELL